MAERIPPSNIGISPNRAPGPSTEMTDSRSSLDAAAMATRPETTTNSLRGCVALGEDAVAPAVLHERRAIAELFEQLGGQCAEEVGLSSTCPVPIGLPRAVASDATGSRPAPASDRRDDPGADRAAGSRG